MKKLTAVKEPMTKTQIMTALSENTGLTKKQISTVLEELASIIERHMKNRGPGQFTFPGLFKIVLNKKPATKARKGINPFTGEETVFKAKPARKVVKIKPLKKLKDMAS
jgi:nucleoid DNA-binding protein